MDKASHDSNRAEVSSYLQDFGLDEDSSDLMIFLMGEKGPITVGEISIKARLDRGKVYRDLERLKGIGVLNYTPTSPIRVSLNGNPVEVIRNVIEGRVSKLSNLSSKLDNISPIIMGLYNADPYQQIPYFMNPVTLDTAVDKIGKMMRREGDLVVVSGAYSTRHILNRYGLLSDFEKSPASRVFVSDVDAVDSDDGEFKNFITSYVSKIKVGGDFEKVPNYVQLMSDSGDELVIIDPRPISSYRMESPTYHNHTNFPAITMPYRAMTEKLMGRVQSQRLISRKS